MPDQHLYQNFSRERLNEWRGSENWNQPPSNEDTAQGFYEVNTRGTIRKERLLEVEWSRGVGVR